MSILIVLLLKSMACFVSSDEVQEVRLRNGVCSMFTNKLLNSIAETAKPRKQYLDAYNVNKQNIALRMYPVIPITIKFTIIP